MTKNYKHPEGLGNGQLARESLVASVVNVAAISYCYRYSPQLSQVTRDTVRSSVEQDNFVSADRLH